MIMVLNLEDFGSLALRTKMYGIQSTQVKLMDKIQKRLGKALPYEGVYIISRTGVTSCAAVVTVQCNGT
jgi:hypothetical protein